MTPDEWLLEQIDTDRRFAQVPVVHVENEPVTHLLAKRPDWLPDGAELYLDTRPIPFLREDQP